MHTRTETHTKHTQTYTQVASLNGQKIYNLAQLVQLVDSCKDEYLHFDLDYNQKVCRLFSCVRS